MCLDGGIDDLRIQPMVLPVAGHVPKATGDEERVEMSLPDPGNINDVHGVSQKEHDRIHIRLVFLVIFWAALGEDGTEN